MVTYSNHLVLHVITSVREPVLPKLSFMDFRHRGYTTLHGDYVH